MFKLQNDNLLGLDTVINLISPSSVYLDLMSEIFFQEHADFREDSDREDHHLGGLPRLSWFYFKDVGFLTLLVLE